MPYNFKCDNLGHKLLFLREGKIEISNLIIYPFPCMQSSSAKGDQYRLKNGHNHPAFLKEEIF